MNPGEQVKIEINDIAFGGDGVGRVDGMAVFVPFVVAGERVIAEIVEIRKRFARGRLVQVLEPSPHRTGPRCPYFEVCAGCRYQHVGYPHQLILKQKQVTDLFERIGKVDDPPVEPVIPSPDAYGYRNKVVLHGPGRPGYVALDGKTHVPVEQCPIARDEISACIKEQADTELKEREDLSIRVDAEGRVVTFSGSAPREGLTERAGELTLEVPAGSFYQVNPGIIPAVVDRLRKEFTGHGCGALVDAYGGVGLFALALSDLADPCIGLETDRDAVRAARKNARDNARGHVRFRAGPVENNLDRSLDACGSTTTAVLLDPPRAGCSKTVLDIVIRRKPALVLYVSCAPDRLARDVRQLIDAGFELERLLPFDLFPQTAHLEVVAVLRVKG